MSYKTTLKRMEGGLVGGFIFIFLLFPPHSRVGCDCTTRATLPDEVQRQRSAVQAFSQRPLPKLPDLWLLLANSNVRCRSPTSSTLTRSSAEECAALGAYASRRFVPGNLHNTGRTFAHSGPVLLTVRRPVHPMGGGPSDHPPYPGRWTCRRKNLIFP